MTGVSFKKIIVLLAVAAGLVFFQNCEFAKTGTDTQSSQGNGDGYTGLTAEYPKVAESGSIITVRILDRSMEGYTFRVLEGDANIRTFARGNAAFVAIAPDYVGNLLIAVTGAGNLGALVEIQVVAPDPLNQVIRHLTFGNEMYRLDGQIAVSIPRKNIDGVMNLGRVVLFDVDEVNNETSFSQKIEAPAEDVVDDLRFGQNMTGEGNDLVVGSPNTNTLYHYQKNPMDPTSDFQLVDVKAGDLDSRYASSLQLEGNNLIVGAKEFNGNIGRVYVYTRPDFDTPFELDFVLDPPGGYTNFGRQLELQGNILAVSCLQLETQDGNQRGVLQLYDISTQIRIRRLARSAGLNKWGVNVFMTDRFLFAGPVDEKENTKEYLDVFAYDSRTQEFNWVQRLNNPAGLLEQTKFGKALVSNDSDLFIGAPHADTVEQEASGVVYTYKFDDTDQIFKRTGYIRPDVSEFEVVTSVGRSLALTNSSLFISIMGKQADKDVLHGSVYVVPLD